MSRPSFTGFYRARDGILLGLCKGLAQSRDLPVAGVRIAVVFLTLMSGFWPGVILYIIAGILIEPEPLRKPESPQEHDFYTRFRGSRGAALHELSDMMTRMDERLQRMEDKVTQPGFGWEARMRRPAPKQR